MINAILMVFLLQLPIINILNTDPLGKKSIPTICSSNDDLPADYIPKTTILGNFI
jgi:hypothetical protein